MKKFLKKIGLFSLAILVFYPVCLFIWGMFAPQRLESNLFYPLGWVGFLHTRLAEAKTVKDVDVLFLGSSHAYRGFDTRMFEEAGMSAFNLGSSGQNPMQTKVLLERHLPHLAPKTIVYEVYPASFRGDGVGPSRDIIANEKNDRYSIKMALEINHAKVYNTLIYALMRDALHLNEGFKEPSPHKKDTYIPGGFVERELEYFEHKTYPEKRWVCRDDQLAAFESVVAMIEERKIELVLVYAPITPALYQSYTNNRTFDNEIQEYGRYYNFNEMIQLDDSLHFYDPDHLNQEGVKIFNQRLIELL